MSRSVTVSLLGLGLALYAVVSLLGARCGPFELMVDLGSFSPTKIILEPCESRHAPLPPASTSVIALAQRKLLLVCWKETRWQ